MKSTNRVHYEPISYSINPKGLGSIHNATLDRWYAVVNGCQAALYLLQADAFEKSFKEEAEKTTFLLRPSDAGDLEKLAAASLYLLAADISNQIEINNDREARHAAANQD